LGSRGEDSVKLGPIRRFALVPALVAGLTLPAVPAAALSVSLIRDAEIEATLQRFLTPLLEASGLGAGSVQIYIVNDPQLNAFVAGGMNLFLNTGLIMATQNPGQLVGVMAHETGHIAGGHLSRVTVPQHRAAAEAILATVLGAATAAIGAPGLGAAVIAGGAQYAQADLMRFSRGQEAAADQAGLTYLTRAGLSGRGLGEFFHTLENQTVLVTSNATPWLLSHPLTRERIIFVENWVAQHPDPPAPAGWADAHRRMVVKLKAFLNDPNETLAAFKDDDSLYGRYARAIAEYRIPELPQALKDIDALIKEHPDDPYFHELKGQMLFENGRVQDAVPPYREAVRLDPDSALLRIGLAQALIETNAPGPTREAIQQLQDARQREPDNAVAWRLLGIAQGRAGEQGLSDLAFAEYALRVGKRDDARLYANRAKGKIAASDPGWLRLQDILRELEES
jgi:predicted Zn-dependent protease